MLLPLGLTLFALLASPQAPVDPELGPQGRASFFGREIAHTMHWTGAPWLLRATREDEENGTLLRKWLAVQPGQAVCDLGCGNGYHTLPLAAAVGSGGKVFAVDLQPEMLTLLRQRATNKHLGNIALIEATVDDPKLPAASCDLVLLVDVYHELSHPVRVMARVRQALKLGGRGSAAAAAIRPRARRRAPVRGHADRDRWGNGGGASCAGARTRFRRARLGPLTPRRSSPRVRSARR